MDSMNRTCLIPISVISYKSDRARHEDVTERQKGWHGIQPILSVFCFCYVTEEKKGMSQKQNTIGWKEAETKRLSDE